MNHYIIKYLIVLSILIMFLTSCRTSFEGVVTFKIDIDHPVSTETMYKKYGDTLKVVYYPNGDMARVHINSDNEIGINFQYFYADKGENHFVFKDGHVEIYDASKFSINKVEEREVQDKLILNEECSCYYGKAYGKYSDMVHIEACYPKSKNKYWLKHKLYRKYQDYWLHQLYKKYKVPYFQYYMQFDEYKLHYDGVMIEKMNVEGDYNIEKLMKK